MINQILNLIKREGKVQIKEAKIKFDAGCFKQACITDALMSQGYNLTLIGKKQADNAVLSSQRASEEAKAFKVMMLQ